MPPMGCDRVMAGSMISRAATARKIADGMLAMILNLQTEFAKFSLEIVDT